MEKNKFYHRHNKLSFLSNFLLLFVTTFTMEGCYTREEDYHVTVTPNGLYFDEYYSEQVMGVEIETDGEWFIGEVSPFIDVYPWRGYGNSILAVKMAERNDENSEREGYIVVQSFEEPENSDTVHVFQKRSK